ncbi:hypothetical protein [Lewinella sp. LCG006]|uniref:hypothetical protein n=1 Tax=Lewinella sp. LCG006 TaxID=3231911 RepID=UPI00345FFA11
MKVNAKKRLVLLIVCTVSVIPQQLFASDREIRIIQYDNQLALDRLEEFVVSIEKVAIINSQTREYRYIGEIQDGILEIPMEYKEGLVIIYEIGGIEHRYYIPPFKSRVLIGMPSDNNSECVKYVTYSSCDSIEDLPETQFGNDCNYFTYILQDYCKNSPIIISPGEQVNMQYRKYGNYINELVNNAAIYRADFCESEMVFNICDELASIVNESEFYRKLKLIHLKDKKGVFSLKFGLNCHGEIVSTELISNRTNATKDDILNIFSNQIKLRPARHRDIAVDSYYVRRYRIRNDWIKLLK